MKSFNNGKQEKPKVKYPDKVVLEIGEPAVAMYVETPREYNGQQILEVLLQGNKEEKRTLWWPEKLPLPPIMTPFRITKLKAGVKGKARSEYSVEIPETPEETVSLWGE